MKRVRTFSIAALTALALFGGTVAASEAGFERMKYVDFRVMIKDAHLAYERENFPRALELYTRNACGGDKGSQFALGTMYLLGQGVAPDALRAYGWYASAAESKDPEYLKSLQQLDQLIPPERRADATAIAAETLSNYGTKATHVYCAERAETGTRISRIECKPPIDSRTRLVEVKTCL